MKRMFPRDLLIIRGGQLSFRHHCWALRLKLEPFDLPSSFGDSFDEDYKAIDTSYDMDWLDHTPESLEGKRHTFPTPSESFDASIYLAHAHYPVDVVELDTTSLLAEPKIAATIQIKLFVDVEYEALQYSYDCFYRSFFVEYKLQLTPDENGWSIGPSAPIATSDS